MTTASTGRAGEPEPTNQERACWGEASLTVLITTTGDHPAVDLAPGADPGAARRVLIDVLANLRHYADAAGLDYLAIDEQADEFYRSELDHPPATSAAEAGYRRYVAAFGDATDALLHLAARTGIAVAWLDRHYFDGHHGVPLTDEQWARVAPLLDSYDTHVSWSDSNALYADQILAEAGIPPLDDEAADPTT
jgi:hypothetical protein